MKVFSKIIFRYRLSSLILYGIIYCFLGFILENINFLAGYGIINNRNQYLPFIFMYGCVAVLLYLVLDTPNNFRFLNHHLNFENKYINNIVYILIIYIGVIIGEIVIGRMYEVFSGVVIWSYEDTPTHITPYTSLITSLVFALIAYLNMKYVFKSFMDLIEYRFNQKIVIIIDIILGSAIIMDFIVMICYVNINHHLNELWEIVVYK